MSKLKDNTMNFIIEEATQLFLKKSINTVTMSEIAKEVGIGDATLYRYFGGKQKIVMEAAVKLAKNVYDKYYEAPVATTGFEKLKSFYYSYYVIYKSSPEYFRFVSDFDAYVLTEVKDKVDYESEVDLFKDNFIAAYNEGVADGTVKELENVKMFYYATTHALLNLCKSLSSRQILISQDNNDYKTEEVKTLIDIILFNITK